MPSPMQETFDRALGLACHARYLGYGGLLVVEQHGHLAMGLREVAYGATYSG
jgi:hypothetical protein